MKYSLRGSTPTPTSVPTMSKKRTFRPVTPNTTSQKRHKVTAPSVKIFTTLAQFERYLTLSNTVGVCTRSNSYIDTMYLKNLIFSPRINVSKIKYHPSNIRRYFVLGKQGFAVGALLDPKHFAGRRIFYLIMICTSATSRGVGSLLMEAVAKEAKENLKCDRIWLSSVEGQTFVYKKWGYRFGPFCPSPTDPLRRVNTITSRPANRRRKIPLVDKEGNPTSVMNPQPSTFYHIRGVHKDYRRIDGYFMTKCLL